MYRIANSQTRTASAPNDVWRIDFKGWFRTRDGQRCDPLTVSDAYSRFLLACVIVPPLTEEIRPVVEQLFRRYGLPLAIRSDNGSLFATTGVGGLSRLSVGWLKAGIALERIVGETWTEQQLDRFGVHRYRPGTARLQDRKQDSGQPGALGLKQEVNGPYSINVWIARHAAMSRDLCSILDGVQISNH